MTEISLSASQQTALEVLDARIDALVQQLQPLQQRRAAVLAEIGLPADATYQRQGERLVVE